MNKKIVNHQDLDVYQRAFAAALDVFRLSKSFPKEEQYSLTDQIRRSSRSVCANVAEAWRRRRYEQAFINRLSIAEGEAAETQVWLDFAIGCGYMTPDQIRELHRTYAGIIGTLVGMINHPETWIITNNQLRELPEQYHIVVLDDSET
jgi:four helix bundle protein